MTDNYRERRSSRTNQDYYTILEVSRTATDEQIKRAYRRLALQLHPDKNSDPESTARFQSVNKAYKVLSDPKLRSTYDFLGAQAADLIDQYEEYPQTMNKMSRLKKILFGLVFCLTGCCFGFCCCCLCGCCCCCNFCCNRCCGIFRNSTVSTSTDEIEAEYNSNSQLNNSIHRQPRDEQRF
ncbi:unnamed protein product [Rotaria sordida]|uniref:J domain-containing protein n=1 Tax=Rotaria sordida TaxID=392033 RepID=A0A815WX79_9BILA|nr:unnamed protein product [Rotaria sordida]CAF1548838.1 unnamed protein product [Rotaria sordida]